MPQRIAVGTRENDEGFEQLRAAMLAVAFHRTFKAFQHAEANGFRIAPEHWFPFRGEPAAELVDQAERQRHGRVGPFAAGSLGDHHQRRDEVVVARGFDEFVGRCE